MSEVVFKSLASIAPLRDTDEEVSLPMSDKAKQELRGLTVEETSLPSIGFVGQPTCGLQAAQEQYKALSETYVIVSATALRLEAVQYGCRELLAWLQEMDVELLLFSRNVCG